MPSASSSSRLPGLRSSGPPGTTTIGRSATGTSSSRSIASASGDPSSSSHLDTSRLRARTSSSRRVPASNREPTSVRPEPRPVKIECRSRNVRRISSLSPSSCAMTTRTCSTGTRSTRPAVLATALRYARWPVSRPISPRNCDRPYVVMTVSPGWPRRSTIRDLTGQHHDQVIGHVPVGKQHVSRGHVVLAAVPAQHLKLRRVQDRAAPGRSLLRSSPAAPGREARRRSSSVSALRAACALPHRGLTLQSRLRLPVLPSRPAAGLARPSVLKIVFPVPARGRRAAVDRVRHWPAASTLERPLDQRNSSPGMTGGR